MESFIQFAQAIALLSAAALCLYLIVTLVRLNATMVSLQRDVAEVAKQLKPLLENLTVVSEKLKSITTQIDEQVALAKGSLESIRRMARNVEQFEERIQQRLEEPIHKVLSAIGGIIAKVVSFFGARTTTGHAGQ
ncbi:MAG: hypothetical protein MUE68_10180 [Bacteroidetes bacterium]|nr:hypothetical protein [Bacteroidota bacterium]